MEQVVTEEDPPPPQPSLPLTSLQKLEEVDDNALHLNYGTQLGGVFPDYKLWETYW